ncbi:hypothetical protein LTR70_003864 [Exophiala xenobiotica]|uniref:Uncharacterized protein n=1 Tax=Lithohypha guttulata TaxID=1690604 RepID=A0ABR0KEY9_9EURO|nr:hypothetical protein LTR24_003446 [Lithohypha guttulata]KAK5322183.1 hypothetical protein LTR70_003864 [Exophiala xenobiotica]
MIVNDYDRAFCDQTTGYALRYFCEVAAPALVNYSTRAFWNGFVLQACYAEACIRDLVIAIVCLERSGGTPKSHLVSTTNQSGFRNHYGRALKQLSQHHDVGIVLISSLLLVLCEDLAKNPYGALMHITSGRRLMTQASSGIDRHLLSDLNVIFKELLVYSPELVSDISRIPCIFRGVSGVSPKVLYSTENSCLDGGFVSMQQALSELQSLRPLCIAKRSSPRPLSRFHIVSGITERLNAWLRRFNAFTASMTDGRQMEQRMIIHGVRAYHLILNICSRCAPFNDESLWDLFQHDLEGLVKKLSILSDCGTRNIATLLFLVACKYRDVAGRRRVIDLLRYDANGSEGTFLADVAERIVYAEEGGLAHPVTCEDIPANARVRPHSSMAGRDERKQVILQRAIDLHLEL